MSWVCSSCGLENVDDSANKCICGEEYTEGANTAQNIGNNKPAKLTKTSKIVHIILITIFLGGLAAGYFWVPIIAVVIDIIFILTGIFSLFDLANEITRKNT